MGWAHDENTIRAQADALVTTGLRALGYRYVLTQECVAPSRSPAGELVVDPQRFPHGIAALVSYIHARGLKAGIYTDIGPYTCYPDPHYQGIHLHDDPDLATFASWGIDLVEADYIDGSAPVDIVFPNRMTDQVSETVSWKPGAHSVRIGYSGEDSLLLDKLVITRAGFQDRARFICPYTSTPAETTTTRP